MAERQIVVVSELAPRLIRGFDAEAAQEFLKKYVACENRLEEKEYQMPLRRCIYPDDLETLLACSEDMTDVIILNKIPEGADQARRNRVRVDISSPFTPRSLIGELEEELEDEDDDGEDGVDTDPEAVVEPAVRGIPEVLRLSNAHIEMMLVHVYGPIDEAESSEILRVIDMAKDEPFTKLSTATNYVRDWKDAMRWCSNKLPRERTMTEFFVSNVRPKKLGHVLKNTGVKKINEMMDKFIMHYRKGVSAKRTLAGMDSASPVDAKPKSAPSKGGAQVPKPATPPVTPLAVDAKDWKASKTCFLCHKLGHLARDCPDNNKKTAQPSMPIKLGAVTMAVTDPTLPWIWIPKIKAGLCASWHIWTQDLSVMQWARIGDHIWKCMVAVSSHLRLR
jgi:hypothetical protein